MTRGCGADYENRIVAGRHPPVGRRVRWKNAWLDRGWPQMIFDKQVGDTRLFAV
jgi:hypothetical protein